MAINNGHTKYTGNIWHNIHNEDQPRWQSKMDSPKTQATFGTTYTTMTNRGGNQKWTIQRHKQHLAQNTQRRPTEVAINNGHTKDTDNIWHNIHNKDQPRWQSIMDIPKTQATCGTIYTTKTNRGGNQ